MSGQKENVSPSEIGVENYGFFDTGKPSVKKKISSFSDDLVLFKSKRIRPPAHATPRGSVPPRPAFPVHQRPAPQKVPPRPAFSVPPKPVQQKPAAPVQQKPAAPVQQKPAAPVQQKPATPVQQKAAAPVQQKPAVPVQQKPAQPLLQKPAQPLLQKPAASIQQKIEKPLPPKPPKPVKQKPPKPVKQKKLREKPLKQRPEKKAKEKKPSAKKEKSAKKTRVLFPIGRKLVAIISLIVVAALGALTFFVSYFVTQDFRISAEETNLAANSRVLTDCENRIENAQSSFALFVELLKGADDEMAEARVSELFFNNNKEIAAIYIPAQDKIFSSPAFLAANRIERSFVESFMAQETASLLRARSGELVLKNASPFFQTPILAIFQPPSRVLPSEAVILYSSSGLGEAFSSGGINNSILVSLDGELLAGGDADAMLVASDESENPVVAAMRESKIASAQKSYTLSDGQEIIGAFKKLKGGGGAAITTVQTAVVLEGIQRTTRRNIYITAIMFFFAALIIYFFSKTISVPLSRLTAVVNEINNANFNTDLFDELKVRTHDEVGVLTESTIHERDILNTFTTLTNKGVTEAIIKKQIDFEPHLKDITIFFSDIRGFTAISDGFKKHFGAQSAAHIINFLNDYMSRMVQCIQLTGGTVDKFEGDAIMACWGVLRNNGLDYEQMEMGDERRLLQHEHDEYVCEDAINAITCCIAMRYALMKYNKDAEEFTATHERDPNALYKPHIRIGAGLNSGRATVGFLGSAHKMEFTSIGDAVNFASRAESSNKPCGTDILITQDTYDILCKDYIRSKENNFSILPQHIEKEVVVERIPVEFDVKGKGKQHFYGVVNMPNFDIEKFFKAGDPNFFVDSGCALACGRKGPTTLAQVRELLGIPEPDFAKVNLNEEENKIQVAAG